MSKNLIWVLLTILTLLSPFFGVVDLNPSEILNPQSLMRSIFFDIRLPRVVFAFFGGVILSLSGMLFQTLFRNALMTPYTLGVSSGAVLGAGIAIKLGLGTLLFAISATTLFGFFGAMLSIFLLFYLSRFLKGPSQNSILLLGIALSLFYTSALMIIFYLGNTMQNDTLIRFTMGSLSVIGWQNPIVVTLVATLFWVTLYFYRFELQLFGISNEHAKLKGVDTKKLTLLLLGISSLAIGTLVSISGPIGFIGLVIPHIVSQLYKQSITHLITKTALFGGMFLVVCDTLSRVINTQSELPIGIITAVVGVPFFIYLIIFKETT